MTMSKIIPFANHDSDEVSYEDADTTVNLLYETRILGKLLKRLGDGNDDLENIDLQDLGRLLLRLTDQPMSVAHAVMHEKHDKLKAAGGTS